IQKCPDLHQGIFGIVVNLPVNFVSHNRNPAQFVSSKIHNSANGVFLAAGEVYGHLLNTLIDDIKHFVSPLLLIVFIIFRISLNCLSSWLTSVTLVPLPRAILFLRLPFMISGFSRSLGVMERMMASMGLKELSSMSTSFTAFPNPGIMPSRSFMLP